jgi:peptidoglycan/xylan/chitin deacetylase (PgdA/CDA1 family)
MQRQATIQAIQNPVEVSDWDQPAAVTLSWTCDEAADVEVRVGAPDGPVLSRTRGPGKATTSEWVRDEVTFFLQDVTDGKPLDRAHTLATVAVTVKPPEDGPRGVILMYHRVAEEPSDTWTICVSPPHFAEHLAVLSGSREVVSLTELTSTLKGGGIRHGSVVITFDDGYADNLLHAMPLLERRQLPATIFVTSGYVGDSRGFWWDELTELASNNGYVDSDLCSMFYRWLWPMGHEERRVCLDRLWRWARVSRPVPAARRPASLEELRLLANSSMIEIGAHSETHPPLDILPGAEQLAEIRQSKRVLEEMLNRGVSHFCYPYGNAGPRTPALVKSAGFESACLASGGPVSGGADLFRLPRVHVRDWDGAEFSRRLARWLGTGAAR